MPLASGDRLGNYEILAPIGKGGMGEVYRAKDTKLDRDVAIKIVPESFAHDPERIARFEREARVLAALNHPNIAQIYGLEERALVMELVEGPTLAERIAKGALPADEALGIAKQIAEALEAAHEKGITHRDLKPANVKITPAGTVKVLDFGLATAAQSSTADGNPSNSPTLTFDYAATRTGMILGTAAYMSPEQAVGKQVDRRGDIWSFGVVLFEMLTGRPLFEGETISHVLADVIKGEIDLSRLPSPTPYAIRDLLKRCLDRDLKNRLQWIGEARIAIDHSAKEPETAVATTFVPQRRILPWAWAALATLAALVVSFLHFREAPPPERSLRYTITAPENSTVHSFAVSPDGRYVSIAAAIQGKRLLWLRALDGLQAQPMPGTDDATYPFWSPDSRYIGFFAQGKLKKIAASGGPAQSLCNAPAGNGGSWNHDDVIVFSPFAGAAIQRVPAVGGVPTDVTKTGSNYLYPLFLPDGRRFLYVVVGGAQEQNGVYMSSLDGSENRRVLADTSRVAFAAGRLLFIRENTLMARPFDAGSGESPGEAFPIAEGVSLSITSYAPISASENGVLLYQSGDSGINNQIVWFDRAGKLVGTVGAPGSIAGLSLSPDEKMMAFSNRTPPTADIWLRDLARGTNTRFTFDASGNFEPFWSPKGDRIVFSSNRSRTQDLYQKSASGSVQDELLFSTPYPKVPDQWSRDGRFIVYSELDPKTKWDLWVLPVGQGGSPSGPGSRQPIPFLQTAFNEFHGQLSPDSRWMAYASDQTGQREVYVRPFPVSDGLWRISTAGGDQPRWRSDGKELFFAGADGKMMAVAVKTVAEPKRSFETGAPMLLFESHIVEAGPFFSFQYDVTADGNRFLVTTAALGSFSPSLTVVVNWTAGLKK